MHHHAPMHGDYWITVATTVSAGSHVIAEASIVRPWVRFGSDAKPGDQMLCYSEGNGAYAIRYSTLDCLTPMTMHPLTAEQAARDMQVPLCVIESLTRIDNLLVDLTCKYCGDTHEQALIHDSVCADCNAEVNA